MGRNTEWRQKGDRMDERDMEKERQNGKRKGWGIERKNVIIFGIVISLDKTLTVNK
jgi:hypothetical protein